MKTDDPFTTYARIAQERFLGAPNETPPDGDEDEVLVKALWFPEDENVEKTVMGALYDEIPDIDDALAEALGEVLEELREHVLQLRDERARRKYLPQLDRVMAQIEAMGLEAIALPDRDFPSRWWVRLDFRSETSDPPAKQ